MKNRLIILIIPALLSLLACSPSSADKTPQGDVLEADEVLLKSDVLARCNLGKYALCGYVDAKIWKSERRNDIRIPAKFEAAHGFNEGLALVRYEGKYGYIDRSGAYVISPRFIGASGFKHGLATVIVENQIGVIGRHGKFVIEPRFSSATIWDSKTLISSDGTISARELSTERNIQSVLNVGLRGRHANRGIFDIETSQWLTTQDHQFGEFNRGATDFIWANNKRGKIGLLQRDGQWKLMPQFSHSQRLIEDRAIVTLEEPESREVKWGAVDGTGQIVIAPKFSYLSYWNNGYGLTRNGQYGDPETTHGLVNLKGDLLGGRFFDEVRRPEAKDDLPHVRIGENWHIITEDGNLEDLPEFGAETNLYIDCETHAYRKDQKGYVVVSANGKPIIDLVSKYGPSFFIGPSTKNSRPRCDLPASLYDTDKGVAVIMPDGTLFAGRVFDNVLALSGGVLSYAVDKKWGLIRQDGNVIVKPHYDRISWSEEDLFLATKDDVKFFIDTSGHTAPLKDHPRYNAKFNLIMKPREGYVTCPNGNKLERKDGKWGMIDSDGQTLIEYNHRALSCYRNGEAWAPVEAKQQWCPIGIDGKINESRLCRDTFYIGPTITHHYPQKLDDNPFLSSVLWNERYLGYGVGDFAAPPHFVGDGVQGHSDWLTGPL